MRIKTLISVVCLLCFFTVQSIKATDCNCNCSCDPNSSAVWGTTGMVVGTGLIGVCAGGCITNIPAVFHWVCDLSFMPDFLHTKPVVIRIDDSETSRVTVQTDPQAVPPTFRMQMTAPINIGNFQQDLTIQQRGTNNNINKSPVDALVDLSTKLDAINMNLSNQSRDKFDEMENRFQKELKKFNKKLDNIKTINLTKRNVFNNETNEK